MAHTAAALVQRFVVGLDTNFYWAAAVVRTQPFVYFFVPYYLLAVASSSVHLRYALRRRFPLRTNTAALWFGLGGALGSWILLGLMGLSVDFEIPPAYRLTP